MMNTGAQTQLYLLGTAPPASRACWAAATHKREVFRVLERLNGEINIQLGPIEVMGARQLDRSDLSDRSVPKPWEIAKGEEILSIPNAESQTLHRDIRDFNHGSALSTRGGFRLHAPP